MRRSGPKGWTGRYAAHTMIGRKRLENVQSCIEDVLAHGVPGDLIETGVWRGGATILMRAVLKAHGVTDRLVWVADSFAGLPAPDSNRYPRDEGDQLHTFRQLAVSLEQVQDNFRRYGLLDDQVRFLKGWFRETLPSAPIDRLAVLRLDGDLYQSTIEALESLYDRISVGGYVIVDDYGNVAGCRQAVHDFRKAGDLRHDSADRLGRSLLASLIAHRAGMRGDTLTPAKDSQSEPSWLCRRARGLAIIPSVRLRRPWALFCNAFGVENSVEPSWRRILDFITADRPAGVVVVGNETLVGRVFRGMPSFTSDAPGRVNSCPFRIDPIDARPPSRRGNHRGRARLHLAVSRTSRDRARAGGSSKEQARATGRVNNWRRSCAPPLMSPPM